MKLLLVGGTDSPHIARWLRQLDGLGWETHLFAAYEGAICSTLANTTVYSQLARVDDAFLTASLSPSVRVCSTSNFDWSFPRSPRDVVELIRVIRDLPGPQEKLARLVTELRPDVIHSFETQTGGYLTLAARALVSGGFPPWIHSLWGNDIYWFGREPEHAPRIRAVLSAADVLLADCRRDVRLAHEWGFTGARSAVFPGPGGFDLSAMRQLRLPGHTSDRRVIAVKGYQDDRGRGLVAVDAVRRCAAELACHEIVVYRASREVAHAAEALREDLGLNVTVMPLAPVEEIWRLMGRSRVAIGLALSDGTPNTMLEAMVMGAFPIQSATEGLEDWIDDSVNGLLVLPEDADNVAQALKRALAEDSLVDSAFRANTSIADLRLSADVVTPQVIALYEAVASNA